MSLSSAGQSVKAPTFERAPCFRYSDNAVWPLRVVFMKLGENHARDELANLLKIVRDTSIRIIEPEMFYDSRIECDIANFKRDLNNRCHIRRYLGSFGASF